MKRPASGRVAAGYSQDKAASRAGPPESLPLARPASAGIGRGRGQGTGQGLPAGHFVAPGPSACATTPEGNFVPRTALPSPGGKGNQSTRGADTLDIGDRPPAVSTDRHRNRGTTLRQRRPTSFTFTH